MTSPTSPADPLRAWFEINVRPRIVGREQDLLSIPKAQDAAAALNNMAEHYFHHWKDADPQRVFGKRTARAFREHLAAHTCKYFGLVWDIADAHKHVELDRPGRRVTRDNQTSAGTFDWGEAEWGEFFWGGEPQLIVVTDSGQRRGVDYVIQNVFAMWERLLR